MSSERRHTGQASDALTSASGSVGRNRAMSASRGIKPIWPPARDGVNFQTSDTPRVGGGQFAKGLLVRIRWRGNSLVRISEGYVGRASTRAMGRFPHRLRVAK